MTHAEAIAENRKLREEVAQLKHDVRQLEVMLRLQRMSQFSPSSERYTATPLFPGIAPAPWPPDEDEQQEIKGHLRRKKKRAVIPENAIKETVLHEVPAGERICPIHGVDLSRGADRTTRRVEWIPAVVKVVVEGKKIVLFHFDPTRSSEVPVLLLEGYRGFVTTDDYSGYNRIEKMPGIRRIQCWMHVRRYFKKALQALGKHGRGGIADQAMSRIRELYAIERQCADFLPDDRQRHRQEFAAPKLEALREWLDVAHGELPPKSATAKAVKHAIDVWEYLVVYVEDGHLLMDNGPAENAIRPVAVGRKNFLFSDSVEGAEATAVLYSIIETAKAHGFDPFAYLRLVIERLTAARTVEDVEALLPWNIRDLAPIRQPDHQNTVLS